MAGFDPCDLKSFVGHCHIRAFNYNAILFKVVSFLLPWQPATLGWWLLHPLVSWSGIMT